MDWRKQESLAGCGGAERHGSVSQSSKYFGYNYYRIREMLLKF